LQTIIPWIVTVSAKIPNMSIRLEFQAVGYYLFIDNPGFLDHHLTMEGVM